MSLPRREHPATAAQHERADFGVPLSFVESLDQRLVHPAGQRVLLLGPVENDRQNRPVARDLDFWAHALSARTAS